MDRHSDAPGLPFATFVEALSPAAETSSSVRACFLRLPPRAIAVLPDTEALVTRVSGILGLDRYSNAQGLPFGTFVEVPSPAAETSSSVRARFLPLPPGANPVLPNSEALGASLGAGRSWVLESGRNGDHTGSQFASSFDDTCPAPVWSSCARARFSLLPPGAFPVLPDSEALGSFFVAGESRALASRQNDDHTDSPFTSSIIDSSPAPVSSPCVRARFSPSLPWAAPGLPSSSEGFGPALCTESKLASHRDGTTASHSHLLPHFWIRLLVYVQVVVSSSSATLAPLLQT